MKRRFAPIITIAVGLILFSGLAYALEKKKQAKPEDRLPDSIHEEEALQAELLAATGEHQRKAAETADAASKKSAVSRLTTAKDRHKADK